ncbi:xanthine dehydrogenase family protein molybdopterin-binding subunit [Brevibacillus humidisoli]|uniref:xanthine dehydrogenase family protein molybdopterin-binding subunit n=1 Tax=Brevibacillus humidisoli TaxID=2895522 RepID=UPI001E4F24F0|nr:xanthine dehydrogenase family protein molybdopterin-binding subunit [Brevibacillus humidisoli]UFJ42448.1 xanthine dehydrogenase family protein molybdopterin-binding subunit [Brevibacillus humidisoli]
MEAKQSKPYKDKPILRSEDSRFLSGKGRYLADLSFPDAYHVAFVRSSEAHAQIVEISTEAARLPGVIGVYSGTDLEPSLGQVPMVWPIEGLQNPGHPLLATEKVRFPGEPIAMVIADSEKTARLAAKRVQVSYRPLPAVASLLQAISDQGKEVQVHPGIDDNIAFRWEREYGDRQAIESADASFSQRLIVPRVAPLPLEPRGVVARYDREDDFLHVWSSTQFPHVLRLSLAAVLPHPESRIAVTSPDVGGAFGGKMNVYREELLVAYFAKRLGITLRYQETRTENFMAMTHGRDQIQDVRVYHTRRGRLLGLDVTLHANMGAYLQAATPGMPLFTAQMLSGCYRIPYIKVRVQGYYTNQAYTDAYRGAGRPEAVYLVERIVDMVARKCGKDPLAVRLRNFISKKEFPYQVVTGLRYDSGDYRQALKTAVQKSRLKHWRDVQRARRGRGDRHQIGIGISSYVEFCGNSPSPHHAALGLMTGGFDTAVIRVHPTGAVTVISGSCPSGQGHHTVWSMLVERTLGVSREHVMVVTGTTVHAPWGGGTFGSRSAAVAGSAIYQACERLIAKGRRYLAHLWQQDGSQISFSGGSYHCGIHKISLMEVAQRLYLAHDLPAGMEPGLEATVFYEPTSYTYPSGTHICIVEVDTDTGQPTILQYTAVDDCGRVLHEQIAAGQIVGGIVQGIGAALYEQIVQDEQTGQLITDSFRSYHLPKAADVPPISTEHVSTPTPVNPLGVKGVGESGTIAAHPAVINAIVDALSNYGVEHVDIPASPEKLWQLCQTGREQR